MKQTLFYLEIILSFCIVCGVTDYISDTIDNTSIFYPADPSDVPSTYCGSSDWVAYKDDKCFKLIKKLATRNEAEIICNQEYFRTDSVAPTLVSIKSAAEQEYLTKFVFDTSEFYDNVWIGAKRGSDNVSHFIWDDGSDVKFTNWAERSPTEEAERDCVVMRSKFSKQFSNISDLNQYAIEGKWSDVSCKIKNLVLCEKLQIWSLSHLQEILFNVRDELIDTKKQLNNATNQLDDTINQLRNTKDQVDSTTKELGYTNDLLEQTRIQLYDTKDHLNDIKNNLNDTINELNVTKKEVAILIYNPVPIGFIYFQLPPQPSPKSLWPTVQWKDVTSNYSGLFFRAEGRGSEGFGKIQEDFTPAKRYISEVHTEFGNTNHRIYLPHYGWSDYVYAGGKSGGEVKMEFKLSNDDGEVRPRNMAMRIWIRLI